VREKEGGKPRARGGARESEGGDRQRDVGFAAGCLSRGAAGCHSWKGSATSLLDAIAPLGRPNSRHGVTISASGEKGREGGVELTCIVAWPVAEEGSMASSSS
jgi:hypothetical protein